MRRSVRIIVTAMLLATGVLGGYVAGAGGLGALTTSLAAQDECATFQETGKQVCGRFLAYWRANGGLAQQGLPLTDEFDERSSVNGQVYRVQYFERAVFELHPENQPPFDVLLSLLGRETLARKYPNGAPGTGTVSPPSPSTPVPPVAPPATSIIGQTLTFPSAFTDAPLNGIVTDFKDNVSLTSSNQPLVPRGRFVAVFMRISNPNRTAAEVSAGYSFVLADSAGRQYDLADVSTQIAGQSFYRLKGIYDPIQPSLSDDFVFIFDVAPDSTGFRLVAVQ